MKKHHIKLAPSEQSLVNASATILAAFIASGKYQESDEKRLVEKSINLAIMLAEQIDQTVSADDELA